jgi:hypothetical protein
MTQPSLSLADTASKAVVSTIRDERKEHHMAGRMSNSTVYRVETGAIEAREMGCLYSLWR